jgi:hypothetical protein
MQPHSLSVTKIGLPAQPKRKSRFPDLPKGVPWPETTVQSCPRVKVSDLPEGHLKQKHIDHLEQNQQIRSCCRHPENHEVEGFKSHPDEPVTDIYIFHCKCGRKHRFFCVGMTDDHRPEWK